MREAEYLYERIMCNVPHTLLAFLVDRGKQTEPVEFPWEHPQFGDFPAHIREQLEHGRNFSDAIHGAALLYNLMLSEKARNDELVDGYREDLENWASEIEKRFDILAQWDRGRFWAIAVSGNPRIPPSTRLFVNTWLDMVLPAGAAKNIIASERARALILDRERLLKRSQARLENQRALELWNGAAGTGRIDYRWGIAQTIVLDIRKGLSNA
jgi:hypothetical protein